MTNSRNIGGNARPMYVIGDVHGDVERLLKLLVAHDIISIEDNSFEWKKPGIVVLLMGDVLDARAMSEGFGDLPFERSTSDLWLMEFLVVASSKAAKLNASVHALVGEHEVRNVRHDFSAVSPYHLRDASLRRAYFSPTGNGFAAIKSVFLTSLIYNGVLYAHAGIPLDPTDVQKTLVNKRINNAMLCEDQLVEALTQFVSHDDFSREPTRDEQRALDTMLRRRRAKKMVIGRHFTDGRGIVAGWNGKVIYTDVGISKAYMPSATIQSSSILYDDGSGALRSLDLSGRANDITSDRTRAPTET